MKYPILQVAYLQSTTEAMPSKRWFLVETNWTVDGPRTRICDGRYETEEEAKVALSKREGADFNAQ